MTNVLFPAREIKALINPFYPVILMQTLSDPKHNLQAHVWHKTWSILDFHIKERRLSCRCDLQMALSDSQSGLGRSAHCRRLWHCKHLVVAFQLRARLSIVSQISPESTWELWYLWVSTRLKWATGHTCKYNITQFAISSECDNDLAAWGEAGFF